MPDYRAQTTMGATTNTTEPVAVPGTPELTLDVADGWSDKRGARTSEGYLGVN